MNKKYLTTTILFASCLVSTYLGNLVILNYFPQRVTSNDLLFQLIPYSITLEYYSDFLFFFGLFLFICLYFFKIRKGKLEMLNIILVFFTFRAILMVFTPLLRPTGIDLPSHGIFRDYITQFGMFPSGHIGLLAVMYFVIDKIKYPNYKKLFLINLIISAILMVVSLGHYSIDVIGGIMLGYIVVNEYSNNYLKQKERQ